MLLLIVAIIFGVMLYRKNLRLEGTASDTTVSLQPPTVRAYVDGKPVKSYLIE